MKIKNFKNKWMLGLLLLVVNEGSAQFTIAAQLPPNGLFTKPQLWNLLVMNPTKEIRDVRIQLNLQDQQTKQTVLTAVSGIITLVPGAKSIQSQNAQPVQYNYLGGNFDHSAEGLLPVGNYEACYLLMDGSHASGNEQLAEDCINIDVEPMSPPLLNSPEDLTVIDYLRPSFSWLPPSPMAMFSNLNYEFLLTPVLEGQSITDAVQFNLPVYTADRLGQNFLQYPASIPALDSGKTYAWQIVAKNQFSYAAKSEVWSFTCKKDSVALLIESSPYYKIGQVPSLAGSAYQGFLKVEYFHESREASLKISLKVLGAHGKPVANFGLKVPYGQNFLVLDLNSQLHHHLDESVCYEASFTDVNGLTSIVRFYPKYFRN